MTSSCNEEGFSGNTQTKAPQKEKKNIIPDDAEPVEDEEEEEELYEQEPEVDADTSEPSNLFEDEGKNIMEETCTKRLAVAMVIDTSASMERIDGGAIASGGGVTPTPATPAGSSTPQNSQTNGGLGGGTPGVPPAISLQNQSGIRQMDVAIQSAGKFVTRLGPNDLVGLVSFNEEATIEQELTNEVSLITGSLAKLKPFADTNIADGLVKGGKILEATPAKFKKVIVLLSDGAHTRGVDPWTVAERQKSKDEVTIITIGYKLDTDAKNNMMRVATSPEYYLDSPNADALIANFRKLAETICEIDQT